MEKETRKNEKKEKQKKLKIEKMEKFTKWKSGKMKKEKGNKRNEQKENRKTKEEKKGEVSKQQKWTTLECTVAQRILDSRPRMCGFLGSKVPSQPHHNTPQPTQHTTYRRQPTMILQASSREEEESVIFVCFLRTFFLNEQSL